MKNYTLRTVKTKSGTTAYKIRTPSGALGSKTYRSYANAKGDVCKLNAGGSVPKRKSRSKKSKAGVIQFPYVPPTPATARY